MRLRAGRWVALLAVAAGFAHAQVFYVGDSGDGTIKRVDLAGNVSTYATGFAHVYGLAADPGGSLYVSSTTAHKVSVIDPSRNVTDYATNFPTNSNLLGMTFDAAGNLYVADVSIGVYKVLPGGSASLWGTSMSYPHDAAFNDAGALYVAGGYNPMVVYSVSSGGSPSLFASVSFTSSFSAIDFDRAGNAFVSDAHGAILKITPAGAASTFLTGYNITDLVIDDSDNIYFTSGTTIYMATAAGTVSTFAAGFSNLTSITLATSVPEPATMAALLGALAFMAAMGWRRSRRRT
ncbi:MAG: PEP-CTERM sorting domain-containing protein [Opitutae bacterium]|nr:PEP-CTERM sorting domain-containing protein [Opitutae bacterium]